MLGATSAHFAETTFFFFWLCACVRSFLLPCSAVASDRFVAHRLDTCGAANTVTYGVTPADWAALATGRTCVCMNMCMYMCVPTPMCDTNLWTLVCFWSLWLWMSLCNHHFLCVYVCVCAHGTVPGEHRKLNIPDCPAVSLYTIWQTRLAVCVVLCPTVIWPATKGQISYRDHTWLSVAQ